MCGRFTLTCPGERLALFFGLPGPPGSRPRYNIAPTQQVLALLAEADPGRLRAELLRWGLEPSWWKGGRAPLINARIESVAQKPSFAPAFRRRRCLIPADGFLEWRRSGRTRAPFHIRFKDRRPFAMAGIWEPATEGSTGSCAILTTAASSLVAPLHERMPVILAPQALPLWLGPEPPGPELLGELARPFPPGEMEAIAVSRRVNDARNEGPECLAEVG